MLSRYVINVSFFNRYVLLLNSFEIDMLQLCESRMSGLCLYIFTSQTTLPSFEKIDGPN